MRLFSPQILGPLWGVSEMSLSLFKRARGGAANKDRHSLPVVWAISLASVFLGVEAALHLPQFRIPAGAFLGVLGLSVFIAGFALRWWSIIHLGRFFTVNVAIHAGHHVVDTGPYRWVRHPSYSGSLLMVLGFVLTFYNWASLLIVFGGCLAAVLHRVRIEEAALLEGLGQPYAGYCRRVKRLVPFVY